MNSLFYLVFLILSFSVHANSDMRCSEKVLICGIGRNVAPMADNTIKNIEALGSAFTDYAVIIYENNSSDQTAERFKKWANENSRVTFISETIPNEKLRPSRTERLSDARNIILDKARSPQYQDFKYLIMADLDFMTPWPIEEILTTVNTPGEWDCVAANGIIGCCYHYDTYALRYELFPFGPELMGNSWFSYRFERVIQFEGTEWAPVYSAFGGLAIYKTASLLPFSYSGTATEDLRKYYQSIFFSLPKTQEDVKKYLTFIGMPEACHKWKIPMIFRINAPGEHAADYSEVTCCEHVPLHASMAIHGFNKIYINPKMYMYY